MVGSPGSIITRGFGSPNIITRGYGLDEILIIPPALVEEIVDIIRRGGLRLKT